LNQYIEVQKRKYLPARNDKKSTTMPRHLNPFPVHRSINVFSPEDLLHVDLSLGVGKVDIVSGFRQRPFRFFKDTLQAPPQ